MKYIKAIVDCIDEELEGAQNYAEKYVEMKSLDKSSWASRFKSMAEDELKHAMYNHDYAVEEITRLKSVYQPTNEMLEHWDAEHRKYVDKTAWIKQMISM